MDHGRIQIDVVPNEAAKLAAGTDPLTALPNRRTFFESLREELASNLLRELTRLGVTKPMRYDPGVNAAD